jgi:hypothetical protein
MAVMTASQLNTILFDHGSSADLDGLVRQDLFFEFSALGNSH